MRMAFLGACALAASGCAGPNALYLHSERDAKEAAEVTEAFAEARKSHAAFLSSEMAFLGESEAETRKQLIGALTKRRDRIALAMLQAPDRERARLFADYTEDRLSELVGDDLSLAEVAALFETLARKAPFDRQIERRKETLGHSKRLFENMGGTLKAGSTCNSKHSFEAGGTLTAAQAIAFSALKSDCDALRNLLARKAAFEAENGGSPFDPKATDYAGSLRLVETDLAEIETAIAAQKAVTKAVNETLKASEAAYECALKHVLPSARLERNFVEVAGFLVAAITPPDEADDDTPETEAETAAEETAETADKAPECADSDVTVTREMLLEKTGFDDLGALHEALAGAEGGALAALRTFKHEITEKAAFEIVADIAAHEPGAEVTAERKEARIALALVGAIGHFQDFVRAGSFPSANALLVVANANRLAARIAAIDAQSLQTRKKLLTLQRLAILSELRFLAAAERKSGFQRVRRIANSWTYGRIQGEITAFELLSAEHRTWLAQEEAATLAAYDIVGPALAELKTYSEGGLKPDLVAEILSSLGITTIAFGGL